MGPLVVAPGRAGSALVPLIFGPVLSLQRDLSAADSVAIAVVERTIAASSGIAVQIVVSDTPPEVLVGSDVCIKDHSKPEMKVLLESEVTG